MANQGALGEMIESARVTSEYTRQGYNIHTFFSSPVWKQALHDRWWHWYPLVFLSALWPLVYFGNKQHVPRKAYQWILIWLWLIAGVLIMLVQAKGYDYHWLPILPPLLLLAANSLEMLSKRMWAILSLRMTHFSISAQLWEKAVHTIVVASLFLTMVIQVWIPAMLYITGEQSKSAYYAQFRGGEFSADESLKVVEYLQARVIPGDSLFIWGFRPEIYFLTELSPATRFIFQFPLAADWYPETWKSENVELLWAALPPYVLVLQGDFMPWVTGIDKDSQMLLQDYNELLNWLIYNYEQEAQIGNFQVWRRKSA